MKKLLVCTAAIGIMAGCSAYAADMGVPAYKAPVVAAPTWTGFYIGGNVGGGWINDRGAESCVDPFGVVNGPICQVLPAGSTGSVHSSGVLGGGQVGYNWQAGRAVFGIETDFQGSGIKGSTTINGPFGFVNNPGIPLALPPGSYTASEALDWFGTVRGRIGYTIFDRAMIYATGGLAYGRISATSNFTAPNVFTQFTGSVSSVKVGWTAGGGLEYAFTGNWSGRIEGLYYDLGSTNVVGLQSPADISPVFQHNKAFDGNGALVRVGINYKFGGPVVAKY